MNELLPNLTLVEDPVASLRTVPEVLAARAEWHPDRVAFTPLLRGEAPGEPVTYGALYRRARRVAADLQARVAPGTPVVLVFPNTPDFLDVFLGTILAGLVAVPLAVPRNGRGMERLLSLAGTARAPLAIASPSMRLRLDRMLGDAEGGHGLDWVYADELGQTDATAFREPSLGGEAVAVLQFTSGSTGTPKGVMVRHANILHNCLLLQEACGSGVDMRMVSWLPFFHDWGLFGCLLFPIYTGGSSHFLDPADFLRRPMRWIEAIARTEATVSCSPNFGYELCAAAVEDEGLPQLDLHAWSMAMMGAEPVRPQTMERFARAFAPAGFSAEALYPSYGLAESTLIVTGGGRHAAPVSLSVDRAALERGQVIASETGSKRTLIGAGPALLDQRVAIVGPETGLALPDNQVGEVWVAGPSVALGYLDRPEETAEVFAAKLPGDPTPWLRTGDLGFLRDGELFVCGRLKDVIIKAGANYFAEDIEVSAEAAHPGLRPGCGAAFGVEVDGTERLVIVHEVNYGPKPDLDAVVGALQRAVKIDHDVFADAVIVVQAGTLEKTSSGKIRRRHTKAQFADGALDPLHAWKSW